MENPPLGPLEQSLSADNPEHQSKAAETIQPTLPSPEQLQQLGKEAYHGLVRKDMAVKDDEQPQSSQSKELSENYFEKRHELLRGAPQAYVGELTPVGEILSKHPSANPKNDPNLGSGSDIPTQTAVGANHSLATDYKRILVAAIITGTILGIVVIFWLAR